jgi:Holliday junction resolvase
MSINILSRDARSSSSSSSLYYPDLHTGAFRTMICFITKKTTTIVDCLNIKNSNIHHLVVFSFFFKKNTTTILKKQSTTVFLL